VKDRRWDIDERGHGVADCAALAPGVHELVEALTIEDWVTEEPEAHLLPHILRACSGASLSVLDFRLDGPVLHVRLASAEPRGGEAHADVFRLIGSFAETATSVRQRGLVYEVVTGMLEPDTEFKTHGHLVRLELVTAE
jgi:hypothetical protein